MCKMYSRKFKVFKLLWLFLLLALQEPAGIRAKHVQKRGVMDSFNDGIKFAGQMFGINTAADVANLVAKAFSTATSSTNRSKTDFMQIFQQRQSAADATPTDTQEAQATQQQQQQEPEQNIPFGLPGKEVVGVNFNSANFVTNVLRMIGFDASKLGALAINALIMIAQAIGNTLMNATKGNNFVSVSEGGRYQQEQHNHAVAPDADVDVADADDEVPPPHSNANANDHERRSRQLRADRDRPLDWFLHRHGRADAGIGNDDDIDRLLSHATDTQLADKLVNMIEKLETSHNEGACLKMLMCKSSPFIWGMQRSLNARFVSASQPLTNATDDVEEKSPATAAVNDGGLNAYTLFTDLPSVAEYRQHGRECEQRYAQHCSQLKPTSNSANNQHENTRKY